MQAVAEFYTSLMAMNSEKEQRIHIRQLVATAGGEEVSTSTPHHRWPSSLVPTAVSLACICGVRCGGVTWRHR